MTRKRLSLVASRALQGGLVALALAAAAAPSLAQRADTTARAGVRPDTAAPKRAVRAPVVDSTPRAPISPKRAFLYSLAVPGLGEARLGRGTSAAVFGGIEAFSLAMARKSAQDLHVAQRFENDSTFGPSTQSCTATVIGTDTTGFSCTDPVRGPLLFNRYRGGRVGARKLHYEDWLAVLVFNHLISGADAFITAQLWDLPARVAVESGPTGGAALAFNVRW